MSLVHDQAGPEFESLDRRFDPRDFLLLRGVVSLLREPTQLAVGHIGAVAAAKEFELAV